MCTHKQFLVKKNTQKYGNKSYGTMRHVRSGKNSSLGHRTLSASAAEAAEHRPLARTVHRVDSGSRQTLLVLQFVIEFANIWAQYSPSTHIGFFDLCLNVQIAALYLWK